MPINSVTWVKRWSSSPALVLEGWGIFNTSVCPGSDRYIMAFEIDKPPEEAGTPFTIRFAESDDLIHWRLKPAQCVYSRDRYTACPCLRFVGGLYYMIYLEERPGPTYEPCIVRSTDLIYWEASRLNPIMRFSAEDKVIGKAKLSPEQRAAIAKAVDRNNSDIDLCEFNGKVVIYYSWGDQQGTEFLAEAVYDGTLESLLRGFFPRKGQ